MSNVIDLQREFVQIRQKLEGDMVGLLSDQRKFNAFNRIQDLLDFMYRVYSKRVLNKGFIEPEDLDDPKVEDMLTYLQHDLDKNIATYSPEKLEEVLAHCEYISDVRAEEERLYEESKAIINWR